MRIAFVYDALFPETNGGVERRVWELARLLAGQGHDVDLLVPKYWDGGDVVVREGVTLRGVSHGGSLYRGSGRRALLPSLRHAIGVFRTVRRHDYDVVDCQVPAHLACLAVRWAIQGRSDASQVVTWHEAWGKHWLQEFGLLGQAGRAVEKRVAGLPATHLSVSTSTASALGTLGTPASAVVEAGVDLARIDRIAPGPESDICFVGRLVPSKNLGLLLESVSWLREDGVEPRVVVVGDGPAREQWERLAVNLNLERVNFVGALPHWESVIATIKGSRVLALPSLREGYGLVVLEAAACGVPVVTVNHPRNAAQDLVDDGVNGFVVPPDPHSFAKALQMILEDDALQHSMGVSAQRRAVGQSWSKTADGTVLSYRR